MRRLSVTIRKILRRSLRTRADSISGNRARFISGGREKFNVNFIVKTGIFLYNGSVAGAIYIISPVTEFKRLR
jgi:hypothetical protein